MKPIKAGTSSMKGALFPIATVTGTGSSEVVTFSNIPQTFRNLVLTIHAFNSAATGTAQLIMDAFNGTSTADRSSISFYSIGSGTALSNANSNSASIRLLPATSGMTSSIPVSSEVHILNYANTATFKTLMIRSSLDKNSSGEAAIAIGSVANTAAITSFSLSSSVVGCMWTTNSRFSLYGLRAVGQ